MSKKYWNSVDCAHPQLKDDLIKKLIDHSYEMVVAGLTKKQKQELEQC
jgi:predicted DNA-binding protein (MmcQ/YjbR family)